MQVSISNFRGIKDASFDLADITIIGGENGAGKTSIAQGISSALTGECPVKDLKKQDYKHLVRIGKPTASVEVKNAAGRAVMQFPDGKGYTEGEPPVMSVFASGLVSPLDMKTRDAAERWIALLEAEPTLENLRAELNGFANAENIAQLVRAKGWDGALAAIKEDGAKHKGRWERITGERYGTAKAESWMPQGFMPGSLKDDEKKQLEASINEKQAAYEESLKKNAISNYQREELAAKAGKLEEHQKDLAVAEKLETDLLKKLNKAKKEFTKPEGVLQCTQCENLMRLENGKLVDFRNDALDNAQVEYNKAVYEARQIRAKITEAEQAKEQLNDCPAEEPNNTASEALQAAKDALAAHNAYYEAKAENAEVMWRIDATKVLAPEGLRKRFLETKLQGFNATLQTLCDAAEWAAVKIEPDLSVSFDEKPFALLSESEQYRTRCTIQAALAMLQKSDLAIYDRADLLTRKGRNGLFSLCVETGLRSVIFLSANKPGEIPKLEDGNKTYWIDKGTIAQIEEA